MKWNDKKDEYTLKSGRKFYANSGMLSTTRDADPRWLNYGADGGICFSGFSFDESPLTVEERQEIADAMILRWKKWRRG